ncbi:glycosyltransferase [Brachybacterium sp. AOP35-5H-19]|uniref:glycosyltransferase n=1 Tax=Brachybacterium sp. AOP35-5H-19 TaxID=3457685 RepID=UPI003FB9D73B
MRVLAVVMGSRGDMLPFLHLGRALRARGHELVIAGLDEFAGAAAEDGIAFVTLPGDCRAMMKRLLGDTEGALDAVRGVRQMLADPEVFEVVDEAMEGVDVVLHNQFGEVARLLSVSRGVPSVRVQAYPTEPSRSYSLVDPRTLDGTRRAVPVHYLSNIMMAWAIAPVMRTWRRRLGLSRRQLRGAPRTLYQFSPSLTPPDPAWGARIRVTGEWLDPEPVDVPLPKEVEEHLRAGDAPLLVSFGSVVSDRMDDLRAWTRAVLVDQGLRAIIVDPEAELGEADGILTVDRVPFAAVLPRCRAVLCHGSIGTTGAALRAGLPCLTVAFGGDQQFHAQAVERNGVGPAYIDAQRGELTEQALHDGVRDLLSARYDEAARAMPRTLASEPGVDGAVEALIGLTGQGRQHGQRIATVPGRS